MLALDHSHSKRNGITSSENVVSNLSYRNFGKYRENYISCKEALEKCCERYKSTTGKKPRSDFNMLFEHILILSEDMYAALERSRDTHDMKRLLTQAAETYMSKVNKRFGFEPIGFDVHLDEGYKDSKTGKFKRNIHIHIQFFNYDFEKRLAPLRKLMAKGKNPDGTTKQLNENFSEFQDLAFESFSSLGFERGRSKNITKQKHQEKLDYVESLVDAKKAELVNVTNKASSTSDIVLSNQRTLKMQNERIRNMNIKIAGLQKQITELSQFILDKTRTTFVKLASNFQGKDSANRSPNNRPL